MDFAGPTLYQLGLCYSGNNGIESDEERAYKYFLEAALLGHRAAEYKVANLLAEGIGVEEDKDAAFSWCHSSALRGHRGAQYRLGKFYEEGTGVERSQVSAVQWYFKASEAGLAAANSRLSELFELGEGVHQDLGLAYAYCVVAAKQGQPDAMYRAGAMLHEGRGTEKNDENAQLWLQRASQHGDPNAEELLVLILSKNASAWKTYFRERAEQGNLDAILKLARAFATGTVVDPDGAEAVRYYEDAVQRHSLEASYELGLLYMEGRIIPFDYDKSRGHLLYAALRRENRALVALGDLVKDFSNDGLDSGDGSFLGKKSSLFWWRRAVERDEVEAYSRIADCYRRGLGVNVDPELAGKWQDDYDKRKKAQDLVEKLFGGIFD